MQKQNVALILKSDYAIFKLNKEQKIAMIKRFLSTNDLNFKNASNIFP